MRPAFRSLALPVALVATLSACKPSPNGTETCQSEVAVGKGSDTVPPVTAESLFAEKAELQQALVELQSRIAQYCEERDRRLAAELRDDLGEALRGQGTVLDAEPQMSDQDFEALGDTVARKHIAFTRQLLDWRMRTLEFAIAKSGDEPLNPQVINNALAEIIDIPLIPSPMLGLVINPGSQDDRLENHRGTLF